MPGPAAWRPCWAHPAAPQPTALQGPQALGHDRRPPLAAGAHVPRLPQPLLQWQQGRGQVRGQRRRGQGWAQQQRAAPLLLCPLCVLCLPQVRGCLAPLQPRRQLEPAAALPGGGGGGAPQQPAAAGLTGAAPAACAARRHLQLRPQPQQPPCPLLAPASSCAWRAGPQPPQPAGERACLAHWCVAACALLWQARPAAFLLPQRPPQRQPRPQASLEAQTRGWRRSQRRLAGWCAPPGLDLAGLRAPTCMPMV